MLARRVALCAIAALSCACFGDEAAVFPPGLEPLEPNTAPAPTRAGALTEARGEGARYLWVHARALVDAPPAVVWAHIKDAELMSASCDADDHSYQLDDDPRYELAYTAHYEVRSLLTVSWDEAWRFGTVEGAPDDPARAMVRYQKVYGSVLIELMEGGLELIARDGEPARTELAFVEHLSAAGGSTDDIAAGLRWRAAAIAAAVEGRGAPACP